MSWTVLVLTIGAFAVGVLLLGLGTLAGRPLKGSCGGSCACAPGSCRRSAGGEIGSDDNLNRKDTDHG